MKIHAIYAGYGTGKWKPEHRLPFDAKDLCSDPGGISGTELQVFGHARELTKLGHDVTVFSRFREECDVDGVRYRELDSPHERCDVAIAYHDGRPLDGWKTNYKVAMHQTYLVSNRQQDATYTGADFADLYLSASEYTAAHLRKHYGWTVKVVPNAWDFGTFVDRKPIPGRLVFTTSVDRGAHRLMEVFPAIKAATPEAHVVMLRRGSPQALARLAEAGVELVGPLSRNGVLELLSTASCYAYPCDVPSPTECFPVSLLEACAAGVPVVLAPEDGIAEIFQHAVWLTPPVKLGDWQETFKTVVLAMLDAPGFHIEKHRYEAAEFVARHRFADTARLLCKEIGL